MTREELLADARAAAAQHEWPLARDAYAAVRRATEGDAGLTAEDLVAAGDAAWWAGEFGESTSAWEAAHQRYVAEDRPRGAAMTALSIAVNAFLRGDAATGAGWMARAQRSLEQVPDCAERGYVRFLVEVEGPLGGIAPGDPVALEALCSSARDVRALGDRHDDRNLVACGLMGEGRALVKAGLVDEGLRLLDEAMVAVLADDLSPDWAGNVYCHLMSAAHELADVRRAVAWTEATTAWLATLPVAALFTGICRVHRSQVHQLTGAWELAEREAEQVGADLRSIQPVTAAEAHHQVGEIRRLRGDVAGAEEAYRRAHELGRDPQPGMALLRLAEGRTDAAAAALRTALLAAGEDRLARSRLLAAQVEVAVASDDHVTATTACAELTRIAEDYGSSGLAAMAAHARGCTRLAGDDPAGALPLLREACRRWRELDAPYDCARARVRLGDAYERLGDRDAAELERETAAATFRRLGAQPDLATIADGSAPTDRPGGATDPLSPREVEVLELVAAGRSNRHVAETLVISEKTVARHLSNIFVKLGVSSRTEAAAVAYADGLITPSRPPQR